VLLITFVTERATSTVARRDVRWRTGRYLVVWLSPEAIETFLGVLEPSQDHAMTT
jgi:hypothetical protein